jgi:transposase InsO family protein
MCNLLGVSRSGYYAWCDRAPSVHAKRDAQLRVLVLEAHVQSRRTYGSPRVQAELAAKGERASTKRIARLMREQGLRARVRRRYRSTTMSEHDQPIAPNLLDRRFEAEAPNERWVGDVTELLIGSTAKLYV